MKNDDLKFRWVQITERYWYCPRFKLTVDKDVITGRWRAQLAEHDSAADARAAAEQQYILKCRESNEVLRKVLNDDYK